MNVQTKRLSIEVWALSQTGHEAAAGASMVVQP